jgi:hypothetical protein
VPESGRFVDFALALEAAGALVSPFTESKLTGKEKVASELNH